jgi:hypothetical protein
MGIWDLNRIDIVASSTQGGERWIMVAGEGFPDDREAEFTVSLLLKLGFHERHASHCEGPIRIELVSFSEPPASLLQWLSARGVEVRVGSPGVPAVGKPSVFALRSDGEIDLAALQAANARAFADAHELPYPPAESGLARLDEIILARRAEVGLDDDESDEELEDTRLMVLAGAYAGEVIRTTVGGEWQLGDDLAVQPMLLAAGPGCDVIANVLGKVRKELKYGSGDAVEFFVKVVQQTVLEQ